MAPAWPAPNLAGSSPSPSPTASSSPPLTDGDLLSPSCSSASGASCWGSLTTPRRGARWSSRSLLPGRHRQGPAVRAPSPAPTPPVAQAAAEGVVATSRVLCHLQSKPCREEESSDAVPAYLLRFEARRRGGRPLPAVRCIVRRLRLRGTCPRRRQAPGRPRHRGHADPKARGPSRRAHVQRRRL